jgi:hypothetical protein
MAGLASTALLVLPLTIGHPGRDAQASSRTAPAQPSAVVIHPGQSWNAAYQAASCGQVLRLAAGIHPTQSIVEDPALNNCSKPVTFQPVSGAKVIVNSSVILGGSNGKYQTNAPSDLVLRGFSYIGSISIWGDARKILVDGVNGGGITIQGVTGVTVRNSDFGPCNSSPPGQCSRVFILDARGVSGETPTKNVLFEHNAVHDFVINAAGDHWECMFTNGGSNVTIRGNRFWNCYTYAIATGARSYSDYDNWIIENNWFGRTCCFGVKERGSAIMFGGDPGTSDTLIRFNTFIHGQGVVQEGDVLATNIRVVKNILSNTGCIPGVRYSGNLFAGGTCSADDRTAVYGYQFNGVRLRVDRPRGKAVQAAFASVARGTPVVAAVRTLARTRRPSPPGGWNARTLHRLLADDVYLGRRLGWQKQHAALVAGSRWRQVQRVLKGKTPRKG